MLALPVVLAYDVAYGRRRRGRGFRRAWCWYGGSSASALRSFAATSSNKQLRYTATRVVVVWAAVAATFVWRSRRQRERGGGAAIAVVARSPMIRSSRCGRAAHAEARTHAQTGAHAHTTREDALTMALSRARGGGGSGATKNTKQLPGSAAASAMGTFADSRSSRTCPSPVVARPAHPAARARASKASGGRGMEASERGEGKGAEESASERRAGQRRKRPETSAVRRRAPRRGGTRGAQGAGK